MPNKSTALRLAPYFCHKRTLDFPEHPLHRGNLVRAHNQQGIVYIEHRIGENHIQQRVFLKKGFRKILQVFYRRIISPCPVHREVEAVLVALHGIGKIAAVRAV